MIRLIDRASEKIIYAKEAYINGDWVYYVDDHDNVFALWKNG